MEAEIQITGKKSQSEKSGGDPEKNVLSGVNHRGRNGLVSFSDAAFKSIPVPCHQKKRKKIESKRTEGMSLEGKNKVRQGKEDLEVFHELRQSLFNVGLFLVRYHDRWHMQLGIPHTTFFFKSSSSGCKSGAVHSRTPDGNGLGKAVRDLFAFPCRVNQQASGFSIIIIIIIKQKGLNQGEVEIKSRIKGCEVKRGSGCLVPLELCDDVQ